MNRQLCAAALVLISMSGTSQAQVVLDGIFSGGDSYSNSESVSWYNGHETQHSIYGDANAQLGTTTIRYGVDTLAGDGTGTEYFFLFAEVPLHAKSMIWEDRDWSEDPILNMNPAIGLTEEDVHSYRMHHETHHDPSTMKLDFMGATGSEILVFHDDNDQNIFQADLFGSSSGGFGLLDHTDSADYVLANGHTQALSLARDRTMSFEFRFSLDETTNNALIDHIRSNGIEFHLSPERGIPAPASMVALGLGGFFASRRRR